MTDGNQTGSHTFQRIRRFLNRGRCRHCFFHERHHPIIGWVASRPVGDLSPGRDTP